ncbi:benzoate 4-monooxygenase cytochrome P450 [Aspergillus pseudoustus]|uniref:Benzoate 4-monooxygenase cytochrome P450 n=1 Tax=Aspergillus pseudoustus TaxID=1810923 RepID=A0ABR4JKK5_9EURO
MEIPLLLLALTGTAIFLIARTVYRLYFHPLSHIPGPKLAAVTHAYEFYYDIWCGGRFLWQIEKMHRQYGPIVRITPREVHVLDPDFYDEIYAPSSRRREKDPKFVPTFSVTKAMAATVSHEHHRFRRNILATFFSKRAVVELTLMIQERIAKLLSRLEGFYASGAVVKIDDALSALAADVITYYCYGKLWGFLEAEDFRTDVRKASSDLSMMVHLNRFLPFLPRLAMKVPIWLVRFFSPGKATLLEFQRSVREAVREGGKGSKTRTIADRLNDPALPAEERTLERQQEEGLIVLAAGTDTTGRIISFALYSVYQDEGILRRLRDALRKVLPTPTSTCALSDLEQIPYLTPIGSSSLFIHHHPTIFPNPEKFNPDRWLDSTARRLDRYLTTFNKGSRACLGMNLAYTELYLTIAHIIRRFDLEIDTSRPEELKITREYFIGQAEDDDPRVRARVVRILEE